MDVDELGSDRELLDGGVDHARRHALMADRRARCPVGAMGDDGTLFLASYGSVADSFKAVEELHGGVGSSDAPWDERGFNGLPEPEHGKVRKVINSLVAGHRARTVEPFTRELADQLLDDVAEAALVAGPDGVDVMDRFVDHLPCAVIAALLGWPIDEPVQLYRWADELCERALEMRPGTTTAYKDICPPFTDYVDARIADRLDLPEDQWPDDGLTHLLRAELDGERWSPTFVRSQIIILLASGAETSRSLIGGLLVELASDPELFARLADDRSLIPDAVEEALRLWSPLQYLVRRAAAPTELGGHLVESGTSVVIGVASANRDAEVFADPDRFVVDRPNSRTQVAFGGGPHVCPGATLARLEARVCAEAFLDRFAAAEVVPGGNVPMRNAMFNGPKSLRLHLTPR